MLKYAVQINQDKYRITSVVVLSDLYNTRNQRTSIVSYLSHKLTIFF